MHVDLSFTEKLEAFIRKYHLNEILRGGILFLSISLFSFLLFLLFEHFLWLSTLARTFLFWGFLFFLFVLLYKFLLTPLLKLFKFKKGLSYEEASIIIGEHFPEISDKVLNTFQLGQIKEDSDLLLASIAQKEREMQSFSFPNAVSYISNKKYLVYFILPIFLFLISFLVADANWIGNSYKRFTNYSTAFTPPSPYAFVLLNDSLSLVQGESFNLSFVIEGKRIPESVKLLFDQESHTLTQSREGVYHYKFPSIAKDLDFSLLGNNQVKQDFSIHVLVKPFIEDLKLHIQPPKHTGIPHFTMHGSGSSQVPEGSVVLWDIQTRQADLMQMSIADSLVSFVLDSGRHKLSHTALASFDYALIAFNKQSKLAEQVNYRVEIIKDKYPSLSIAQHKDSIESNLYTFSGIAEDDYGLKSLQFIVFPTSNPSLKEFYNIPLDGSTYESFEFVFDTKKYLSDSGAYTYYFELTDNDRINGFKITKSDFGVLHALSTEALKDSQLDFQKDNLEKLSKSVDNWKKENTDLEGLIDLERNENQVLWEDLQKVKAFAKQESSVLDNLNKLTQDLQKNLETMQNSETTSPQNQALQERMQEQLNDLKRSQELLDKLAAYEAKIANETLQKEVEEYKQQKKIQEKNLGQLLELTKRFYVSEKNSKLAADLMQLAEKQTQASEVATPNSIQEQDKLNSSFEAFQKEMEALIKENQKLLRPFNLHQDKATERRIHADQQDALDKLKENALPESKVSQRAAGQKMKELAEEMIQEQESGDQETAAEDANVLRQILDNLLRFSFSQEDVLNIFKATSFNHPKFGSYLTNQFELKSNFRHVNDSLFSLSLRQASFGKEVHSLATKVDYHIDTALDDLAQNRLPNGLVQQQYALSNANELAALLSDILDNMQMNNNASSGKSKDPKEQLSDIIEKQKSLMQDASGDSESSPDSEPQGTEETESSSPEQEGPTGNQPLNIEEGSYSDTEAASFYDIYKQQQELKMQLEDYIQQHAKDLIHSQSILQDMDAVSLKMLDQGASQSNINQMQRILHKLLELEKANLQQEESEERKASWDFSEHTGSNKTLDLDSKKQLPTQEQLNKESLHLKPFYRNMIQRYLNN